VTCLVATSKFIAADRRVTDSEGGLWPNQRKVFSNRTLVAAYCGLARVGADLEKSVREGLEDPRKLIDMMSDHSGAIVLMRAGPLWWVGCGESTLVRAPVYTAGSGGDLARGYLGAKGKHDAMSVRAAIRFASLCRTDCGGGCDIASI